MPWAVPWALSVPWAAGCRPSRSGRSSLLCFLPPVSTLFLVSSGPPSASACVQTGLLPTAGNSVGHIATSGLRGRVCFQKKMCVCVCVYVQTLSPGRGSCYLGSQPNLCRGTSPSPHLFHFLELSFLSLSPNLFMGLSCDFLLCFPTALFRLRV